MTIPTRLALACVLARAVAATSASAQPLASAPYVAPPLGTRYVFQDFTNTITRTDGWRTYFTDGKGNPGLRVGTFISDNPTRPLSWDPAALQPLWPLHVGASAKVPTQRGDLKWRWELSVVDTETVKVPAGTFRTFVVQAIEVPVVSPVPNPPVNLTMFWYAPAVNAVVRLKSGQLVGPRREYPIQQQLLRIERSGATKKQH